MKNFVKQIDYKREVAQYFKAILFLLFNGISVTFYLIDAFVLYLDWRYKDWSLREFIHPLVPIAAGWIMSAIKIIKEEVVVVPKLQLSIKIEREKELEEKPKEGNFFLIRWEKQKIGTIVTRYEVFVRNEGSMANLPYIVIKNSKLDDNFANLSPAQDSLLKKQEDSRRVVYNDVLMKKESAHIATLGFYVRKDTETKPGDFFELPIIFGAFDTKEKEIKWKFKYRETKNLRASYIGPIKRK